MWLKGERCLCREDMAWLLRERRGVVGVYVGEGVGVGVVGRSI